jgi:hypothetical protein
MTILRVAFSGIAPCGQKNAAVNLYERASGAIRASAISRGESGRSVCDSRGNGAADAQAEEIKIETVLDFAEMVFNERVEPLENCASKAETAFTAGFIP